MLLFYSFESFSEEDATFIETYSEIELSLLTIFAPGGPRCTIDDTFLEFICFTFLTFTCFSEIFFTCWYSFRRYLIALSMLSGLITFSEQLMIIYLII